MNRMNPDESPARERIRGAIAGSLIGQRAQGANFRQTVSQPRGLGEVDAESVSLALVAAGHLGAGVAEMFLDVTLIDIC
jgi:hypothetical protein